MAIPVLLILAVLWAAVLVPPVLRSRSETRRRGTVGDFTSELGAVTGRRSPRSRGSRSGLHAVPTPQFRSMRSPGNGARAAGGASRPVASGASAPMSPAQKRRRDVLVILGCTAIGTLLLGLVLGSPLVWIAQALADLALVVYVVLLVLITRRGSLSTFQWEIDTWPPASRAATRPLAHPKVPPRPELAYYSEADPSLPPAAAR